MTSANPFTHLYPGPADLRLALGLGPALDGTEPEFVNAMAKIVAAAKKHGKVVGTMGIGEEVAKKRASEGFDFLVSSSASGAMVAGIARELNAARSGVEAAVSSKL